VTIALAVAGVDAGHVDVDRDRRTAQVLLVEVQLARSRC
jgi:hypothetical protein